jgi:choice-of-anchor B domain-containing protein
MKLLLSIFFLLVFGTLFGQFNTDTLSHIDYQALHGANLNDVWGYVDELGNEYAIVGTSKGTSIVNVTDPLNPVEVFWISGTESIWRDPSVNGNFAYVTTEAEDGLLIIDLTPLPASTNLPTAVYTGPVGAQWQSAHTCFVDEQGYGYIFGANRGNGGAIILDLFTNPMSPIEVGTFDDWYVHDGFVRNDTMYLAHISDGFFSIVNATNRTAPVLVSTTVTPNNFTHTIWPTDNGSFAFVTDEVSGAYITAYDISDPTAIVEVDRTQHSPGQGVVPHNIHVRGDYLVTSYYSDGVTIHDVTFPDNMVLVGRFDTYPGQTTGFNGCWGVYPYLPSSNILAADISEGLFVIGVNYQKACYLRGTVTDVSNSQALAGVEVQILTNEQSDLSTAEGGYATGIFNPGTYSVKYSKVGYFPQTVIVTLSQGQTTIQDIQLVPLPPFNLTVTVLEEGTLQPIPNAQILFSAPLIDHEGITNGLGQENLVLYYQDVYEVYVGIWGHISACSTLLIDQNTGSVQFILPLGYFDDFKMDLGWIVNSSAVSGRWERGKPNTTNSGSAPALDAEFDCGISAYITGNDASLDPDYDDVDGGFTNLISPSMDLTGYTDPYVNFNRWFYCYFGAPPNDTMKILLSNGLEIAVIDMIGGEVNEPSWQFRGIRVSDFLAITNSMQIRVRVSDFDPDVNITEAGFDRFFVSEGDVTGVSEVSTDFSISPNPFNEILDVKGVESESDFVLYDALGAVVLKGVVSQVDSHIDTHNLQSGLYVLNINGAVFRVIKD